MGQELLKVSIVTPTKHIITKEVDEITAPGAVGEIGILPNHRAFVSSLKEGGVTLFNGKSKTHYAISGGYLEVSYNQVSVLAETAEISTSIDIKRARTAVADAQEKMDGLSVDDIEYKLLNAKVRRNRVRIKVSELN